MRRSRGRPWLDSPVRGVLAGLLVLVALVGAPRGVSAVSPVLGASVDQNRDLALAFADGSPIGSSQPPGTLIPPGTYQVNLSDDSDISNFHLSGPGVELASSVEAFTDLTWTATFQPCALYSYANDTAAGSNQWFQTSASPASTVPCAGGATVPGATPGSGLPAGAAGAGAPVGSASTKPPPTTGASTGASPVFRGTLVGALTASGRISLTAKGKPVTTLRPGRYTVSVSDASSRHSFLVQQIRRPATAITGASFVGKRTLTVDLTAGQWFILPGPSGKRTYFVVIP